MIQMRDILCRFGKTTAVNGITLDVPSGDSVALWGANGAGKTTLIRCALGLYRFAGRAQIAGFDVRREGKRARMMVGYVPQELGFYDDLRTGEALQFFARLKSIHLRDASAQLETVGLAAHSRKRIRELSGGMKQRLALAIALIGDPPVLILDEVTASLDALGRQEFMALLSRLTGMGRTMLFASHRMEEVTTLARRVVVLENGVATGQFAAGDFARAIGADLMLHITMRPSLCASAIERLRASGFAARRNGVGILVPVTTDQKAGPFRVLAEASIAVDDFEVLSTGVSVQVDGREVRS